jgi:hypothetical protein
VTSDVFVDRLVEGNRFKSFGTFTSESSGGRESRPAGNQKPAFFFFANG